MLYYVKDRIIKYNGINGGVFPFLLDLKKMTGSVLGRICNADLSSYRLFSDIVESPTAMGSVSSSEYIRQLIFNSSSAWSLVSSSSMAMAKYVSGIMGWNPSSYDDMDEIVNSSTAMDEIVNSSTAMNAIANSPTAMDKIVASSTSLDKVINSSTAMDEITKSPTAMDKIVISSVAVDKIISSAIALYYICINNSQGEGLKKLASNIEGTTTTNWENDTKWQTIYDTLNEATDLFTKTYYTDTCCCMCTIDRRGDWITLVESAYGANRDNRVWLSPRYSGCYNSGWLYYDSTGKHIMWGGHSSTHDRSDTTKCYVKHYKFTPIT